MAALVTLAQAKDQLSITHSDQDVFVQMKLDEAQALVLQYCDKAPVWDAVTVPLEGRSAILDVVTDLYTDRGDTDRPAGRTPVAVARGDCGPSFRRRAGARNSCAGMRWWWPDMARNLPIGRLTESVTFLSSVPPAVGVTSLTSIGTVASGVTATPHGLRSGDYVAMAGAQR